MNGNSCKHTMSIDRTSVLQACSKDHHHTAVLRASLVPPLHVFLQQELRGKLLAEAESSAAANAAVAVRWGAVLGLDVPQELFQAIEEQRMACEAVIASKDRLIAGALLAAAGCMQLVGVPHQNNSEQV